MNKKFILISSIILVVLVVILVLQLTLQKETKVPTMPEMDKRPFSGLSAGTVAKFTVKDSKGEVITFKKEELAKEVKSEDKAEEEKAEKDEEPKGEKEEYFGIEERNGYPAGAVKVHDFLTSLMEVTFFRRLPATGEIIKECEVGPDAVCIKLFDKNDSQLTELYVGKDHRSAGSFVRLPAKDGVFVSQKKISIPESWIVKQFPRIPATQIESVNFSFPREGGEVLVMGRKEGGPLKFGSEDVTAPQEGRGITRTLERLSIDEFCGIPEKEAGLEKPTQVTEFKLKGGSALTVSIGNVLPWDKTDQKRRRYVTFNFERGNSVPEDLKENFFEWEKRSVGVVCLFGDSREFGLLDFTAPMLQDLEKDNLTRLNVTQKEQTVTLAEKDSRWKVLNGYDFAADPDKFDRMIKRLKEIEVRPGDIANPGVGIEPYKDTEDGNIKFTLTDTEDNELTFTRCKKREKELPPGAEEDSDEKEYLINDVAEKSDSWGRYYIKPSGNLTFGTGGPYSIDMEPRKWLQKDVFELPEKEISSLKLDILGKKLVWTAGEEELALKESPPGFENVSGDDLLGELDPFSIFDVVKKADKELTGRFDSQKEKLNLVLLSDKDLQVTLNFKGTDDKGHRLGVIEASYTGPEPEASGSEEASANPDEEALGPPEPPEDTNKNEAGDNSRNDNPGNEEEKKDNGNGSGEEEKKKKEIKETKELAEKINSTFAGRIAFVHPDVAKEFFVLPLREEKVDPGKISSVTIAYMERASEEGGEEEEKASGEDKGPQEDKAAEEEKPGQEETEEEAPETEEPVEKEIKLTKGDDGWKIGDKYADEDKLNELWEQLNDLDLRYGNSATVEKVKGLRLSLSGEETKEFKIGEPFEITNKYGTSKKYKFVEVGGSPYLIADNSLTVETDPKEWEDPHVIRLETEDIASVTLDYPAKSRKHEFVAEEGKIRLKGLPEDHVMLVTLSTHLENLLDDMTKDKLQDKGDDIKLVNTLKLAKKDGGTFSLKFSEEEDTSVYVKVNSSGTSRAKQLSAMFKDKVLKVGSYDIKKFLRSREELESLQVTVSDILVTWEKGEEGKHKEEDKDGKAVKRTKEEARSRIEEVKAKLEKPDADFAELALEYSDAKGVEETKGRLSPPINKDTQSVDPELWGVTTLDPKYKEAALSLENVGEISDIIETGLGFHIIRRDK